jgi:protein SCO1/2
MAARAAVVLAAALALAGCDRVLAPAKSPFHAIDVTGAPLGRSLALVDHNGVPRTLADFRGKVVLVNFGYTQCPDVCPTTLADLASAVRKLGPEADRVQVLFVTVDPRRDTRELLARYVPAFDPRFLGLRGDAEATERVTKEFRVYAAEHEGKTPESYTVDHSAQTFAFDPQGRLRLVIAYGAPPDDIAADLRLLLNS